MAGTPAQRKQYLAKAREYKKIHSEKLRADRRAYWLANMEREKASHKIWLASNEQWSTGGDKKKASDRRYYNDNKELISQKIKAYLPRKNARARQRRVSDPRYLIFLPGMSWERRSDIHIDHIRPCASFDLTDPEQQKQCFHYTNLKPLWARDNLLQSSSWEGKIHRYKRDTSL